jgi:D-glycero-D-manno-heptose 1,7-bisphosphate phosphatase
VKFWRRPTPACYGRPVPGRKRALFIDWGGTLALTKDNRTVVDAAGDPVLMPNVAATLARERPRFELCFIVSNQARITRGEIAAAEVVRRFAWANARLGEPFTDWRLCPHGDEHGCACRKPKPGMFLELAGIHDVDLRASVHVGDSAKDQEAAARAGIGRFIWARDFFEWEASS